MPDSKSPPIEYCPACHRAGPPEEVLKSCGYFLSCRKKMEPIDPEKLVVVSCAPCGKSFALEAHEIMTSKVKTIGNHCQRGPETCAAKVVHLEVSPVKAASTKKAPARPKE